MRIFKEKPGIISEEAIWVCIDYPYIYTGDTFFLLCKQIVLEFRDDKHLAGY